MVIGLIMFSCGGGGSQSTESSDASADFDEASDQIISEIDQVISDLPPPSEVPYLLMATGSDYDPSLINSLENVDSYSNPASKAALNLGVFITDIGYLSSYEKAQEALDYISACQKLAESLGVASAMDLELLGRFERNLSNKDSLKSVVDDILSKTGSQLGQLDQMHVAGLVLTGTYIEGLYVSTNLIANYPDDLGEDMKNLILEPLIKIVIDQKAALEDLITVMNDLSDNADAASVLDDLNALKAIYDGELAAVSQQISENTGDLVITADVLASLTTEATRIRSSYTE